MVMSTPARAPAPAPRISARSLSADVVVTLASKVMVLVLQVASAVLVARKLGPSGRGVVAVALTLVMVMQQLGSLGLASANPYFGLRDRTTTGRIAANSLLAAGVIGGLLAMLCLAAKEVVPVTVRGLSWLDVSIVALTLPASLVFLYLQAILLGQGKMLVYNLVEAGQNVLGVIVLAIGLLVIGMGVTGSVAVVVSVYWVGAAAYIIALNRGETRIARPDIALARAMVRYAFRIYVAGMMSFLIIRLDLFLVNGYLGSQQAGLYAVAGGLADALFLLPMVIGLNIFPRIASGAGNDTSAAVFRLVSIVYAVVVLASAVAAPPIIDFLYGNAFASAADLYRWLAPGVFSLGLVTVLANHFAGRGFPLNAMFVWLVGLAVNLAINLTLLARYGTYIAALSSSVTYTLLLVLHLRMFVNEVGGWRQLILRPSEVAAFLRTLRVRHPPTTS